MFSPLSLRRSTLASYISGSMTNEIQQPLIDRAFRALESFEFDGYFVEDENQSLVSLEMSLLASSRLLFCTCLGCPCVNKLWVMLHDLLDETWVDKDNNFEMLFTSEVNCWCCWKLTSWKSKLQFPRDQTKEPTHGSTRKSTIYIDYLFLLFTL